MESSTLPRTAEVKLIIDNAEVPGIVKKVALGDFAKLSVLLESLMVDGMQGSKLLDGSDPKAILELLKTAPHKLAEIVALLSTFSKEQVLQADLDTVVEVLMESWQLNNLVKMFSGAINKVMGKQAAQE